MSETAGVYNVAPPVQEHRHVNDRPDSIEIGTPSKGGAVKVYFDARDPDGAIKLVANALVVRAYAIVQAEAPAPDHRP